MENKNNFKIFILGHKEEQLSKIPKKEYLCPINLNHIELPIPNTNDLAENRFFLLDPKFFTDCPEYIGVLSANYEFKYPELIRLTDFTRLQNKIERFVVYAANPTESFNHGKWLEYSYDYHKTIKPYIEEMAGLYSIKLENRPTFWANNFLCHKDDFLRFIKFFKDVFNHMHAKYRYDFDIHVDDTTRKAAYFYERVSMLYFSRRQDLVVRKLPGKNAFDINKICWMSFAADNYKPLWDICFESLVNIGIKKENIKHEILQVNQNIETKIMFGSAIWHYSNLKKLKKIIEIIQKTRSCNQYDYFVYHDCDVQFFENRMPIWEELFNFIETTDSDIYFQPEIVKGEHEICAGFFIIKKTKLDEATRFFKYILKEMNNTPLDLMPMADQSVIKKHKDLIHWSLIPEKYCAFAGILEEKNKKTYLFHHAINAKDLEAKMVQMIKTKKFTQ